VQRNAKRRLVSSFDQKQQANARKLREAEECCFKMLEKRWVAELRGNQIPEAMRRQMRGDEFFQTLVAEVMKGGDMPALEDRDHTPDVQRLPDGSVESRMQVELGGDPRRFMCLSCDEEVPANVSYCEKCENFNAKGIH
jgi:hypothetical protein